MDVSHVARTGTWPGKRGAGSLDRSRRFSHGASYLLLVFGLGIVLLPFWYMLITSLKPDASVWEYPPRLWPTVISLNNYVRVVTENHFGVYFGNSALVAVVTCALTLLVSSMMAFAFARLSFPFKEPIFSFTLLGLMVPPVMLIIPQFLVARALSLFNNYWGLILVYATMNLAMQTFLLRGVFEGVPRDLEEAAMIDGAAPFTVFWRVVLPLARPGLAVVIINTFLYSWEEYAWALVSMTKDAFRTLPIAIANFHGEHMTSWGLVFAATVIALVPVLAVFAFFQRYFVQGLTAGAVKG